MPKIGSGWPPGWRSPGNSFEWTFSPSEVELMLRLCFTERMTNFAAFTVLVVYVSVATFFHLSSTPPITIGMVSALLNGAIALYLFDSGSMGCVASSVGCFNVISLGWLAAYFALSLSVGPWWGTVVVLQLGIFTVLRPGLKLGALFQMILLNLFLCWLYLPDLSKPSLLNGGCAAAVGTCGLLALAFASATMQARSLPPPEELS